MAVNAINTTPEITKQSNPKKKTAISILGGMGAGALINGAEIAIKQKSLIKNPDKFIKTVQEEIEANPETKEQGETIIKEITDFAKAGKIDKKAVGTNALKGAVFAGVLFGAISAISEFLKSRSAKKAEKTQPAQQG